MLRITDNILPQYRVNRPGRRIKAASVTVHETGNTSRGANARAHASYLLSTPDRVSWHYTVDENEAVRHLPENENAWHSGTAAGNDTSIGVEICVNADGNFIKAVQNAAELCADICRRNRFDVRRIKQHFDWNRKNCPQTLRKNGWDAFARDVAARLEPQENNNMNTRVIDKSQIVKNKNRSCAKQKT